jgi:hypothetical protein
MLPPVVDTIWEFIPTNSPRRLTNAPPELPWLIGASVCRKSSKLPLLNPVERLFALMIPEVTVCPMPRGLPKARQRSPTRTLSELARARMGRSLASTFKTARSLSGSVPTSFAENVR